MTYVEERILTITLLEQMKKFPQLSQQLGLKDKSENKDIVKIHMDSKKGEII